MPRPALPSRLVLAATGVGALHVLDDTLVTPGLARVGDHVASTVVPLAWLVALAALAARSRPGTRALAHLALGATLLTLGAEAAHHASAGTLAGDDRTGVLALAAGLATAAAGARLAWQARRTDGPLARRCARRAAKAVALLAGVLYLAYPASEAYVFTHVATTEVPEDRLGIAHEDVTFRATDGVELHGWYVPSRNGAAVVLYPGRGANQRHARLLADHGYGVLLFDHRGAGASGGEPNSWGWAGHHDIRGAIDLLEGRPDVAPGRIGGLGLSVGGEALLHTAAVDDRLAAVVSEGAGARSWYEFRELDGAAGRLWGPTAAVRMGLTAAFADRMPPPALHDLVPRIEAPTLFIQAARPVGGEELTSQYHALASAPAELWHAPGDHTQALAEAPAEYERRVVGFFDEHLLEPR